MIHTKSAGGVVLNRERQVLVVSQHGTSWSLPKGSIEDGEDTLDAARREIYEESGIGGLKLVRELGNYERFWMRKDGRDDTSRRKTIVMFLFETDETALAPLDPENPEARWVDRDEVEGLLTHPKDKEFFANFLELNQAVFTR